MATSDVVFPILFLRPFIPRWKDGALPEAARGGGAHRDYADPRARAKVQGPGHHAQRVRAGLHQHQSRRLHRIQQVSQEHLDQRLDPTTTHSFR